MVIYGGSSSNCDFTVLDPPQFPKDQQAASEKLIVQRKSVNVTAGQSIHFPTSYTLPNQLSQYLIQWTVCGTIIVDYNAYNCSISSQGIPEWCDGKAEMYPKHKGRVQFYHLNATLVLKDARVNDTGIYTIRVSNAKEDIQVRVHEDADNAAGLEYLTALRKSVTVAVGQSIHLPMSYMVTNPSSTYLIEWTVCDHIIVDYYTRNCSIGPQGIPEWCDGKADIHQKYKERVTFFPLNASLVLRNAQLNDKGIYTVRVSNAKQYIQVSVREDTEHVDNITSQRWNVTIFCIRMVVCFLPVVSLAFIVRI